MKIKETYKFLGLMIITLLFSCNSLENNSRSIKESTQKEYRLVKIISGQVNKEVYYEYGYSFDDNNELCYEYSKNDGEYEFQKYYKNGMLVEDISGLNAYDSEGVEIYSLKHRVIEYCKDLNGNINLKIRRDILENVITSITRYLYDERNRKVEMQWLSIDGKYVQGKMIYKYYNNDKLKSETRIWDNVESYRKEYKYNENSETVSFYERDRLIKYTIFTYDDENNIIKEERRFPYEILEENVRQLYDDDPIELLIEYKYDENNNLIFRHVVSYDVNNHIIVSEYINRTKFNEMNQPIREINSGKELLENGEYKEWENIQVIEYSDNNLEGYKYYGIDDQLYEKYIYEEYYD